MILKRHNFLFLGCDRHKVCKLHQYRGLCSSCGWVHLKGTWGSSVSINYYCIVNLKCLLMAILNNAACTHGRYSCFTQHFMHGLSTSYTHVKMLHLVTLTAIYLTWLFSYGFVKLTKRTKKLESNQYFNLVAWKHDVFEDPSTGWCNNFVTILGCQLLI